MSPFNKSNVLDSVSHFESYLEKLITCQIENKRHLTFAQLSLFSLFRPRATLGLGAAPCRTLCWLRDGRSGTQYRETHKQSVSPNKGIKQAFDWTIV